MAKVSLRFAVLFPGDWVLGTRLCILREIALSAINYVSSMQYNDDNHWSQSQMPKLDRV